MNELELRDAEGGDAAAIARIYRPFVEDSAVSFEVDAPDDAEMAARIEAARARYAWLVAIVDGRVVGYAYAGAHRARAGYRFSVETSAYVDDGARGRGVGRALYDALLDRLVARGFCSAYAGIVLPNDASVALHRAVGFVDVGVFRRVGWKLGRFHDVMWLERPLALRPPDDG
jgi:phosphinothricin acetyltransferase